MSSNEVVSTAEPVSPEASGSLFPNVQRRGDPSGEVDDDAAVRGEEERTERGQEKSEEAEVPIG